MGLTALLWTNLHRSYVCAVSLPLFPLGSVTSWLWGAFHSWKTCCPLILSCRTSHFCASGSLKITDGICFIHKRVKGRRGKWWFAYITPFGVEELGASKLCSASVHACAYVCVREKNRDLHWLREKIPNKETLNSVPWPNTPVRGNLWKKLKSQISVWETWWKSSR